MLHVETSKPSITNKEGDRLVTRQTTIIDSVLGEGLLLKWDDSDQEEMYFRLEYHTIVKKLQQPTRRFPSLPGSHGQAR